MSLRYALLALLTSAPMTGYEISQRFQSSVGHVWHAPDSQIYPELRKMEADGLVEAEAVDGDRGAKRFYRPTAAGVAALRDWMNTPLKYALDRDPAHLKAAYFEWADPGAARQALLDHIERYRELRAQWQGQLDATADGTSPVLSRRLQGKSPEESHRITAFKQFAYEGLIARADAEMAWARRGLALLDDLG
jgi:DNA-binding PadR family transcriptional regulator